MYKDYMEKLKPLPKFNLDWYHGVDAYSDGDIEDQIIQIIANNEPEDYTDAIYDNFTWPTYYHLTRTRKNILNWYPFREDADLLEIGCGLGAITGDLCDRCRSVTAVELSKRRATATLLRCRKKDNLEIIVGNLNDISFGKKFDYIILIGVLEHQNGYTNSENPHRDFLKKIKQSLNPQGKLLVAIENQYGLKYWCGAPEDHAGIPFLGMNQYSLTNHKVKTFSKEALSSLIRESGFKHHYFYYPLPDYKLPAEIYSEEYLPQKNTLNGINFYSLNPTTLVAKEKNIYQDVIDNGVFEFFANSFLVECSDAEDIGECKYAKLQDERTNEYRIGTRFMKEHVEKFPLASTNQTQSHIENCQSNLEELQKRRLDTLDQEIKDNRLFIAYQKGILAEDYLISIYEMGNIDKILAVYQKLYDQILQSSNAVDWKKNAIYDYGLNIRRNPKKYGTILENAFLDMLFQNAFFIDGEFIWFDQEWKLENIPAKFVIYRAIAYFYQSHSEMAHIVSPDIICNHFDIDLELQKIFIKVENKFKNIVLDEKHRQLASALGSGAPDIYVKNINKLLGFN